MYISDYLSFLKKIKQGFARAELELSLGENLPGYALAIYHDNHVVFEKFCGVKDLKSKQKIDADTPFLLASLTQPLIAQVFLRNLNMIEDNQVNYYLKNSYKNITIGHLIQHQSGLQDYLNLMSKHDINNSNLDNIVNNIFSWRPNFKPGLSQSYTNSGFVVLSKILEVIYKQNYSKVVEEQYKKINLNYKLTHDKTCATSYEYRYGKYKKVELNRYVTGWGDGYSYSSVCEYPKIFTNQLLMQQLLQTQVGKYGKYYIQNGLTLGGDTCYCFIPSLNLHVVLLSNMRNKSLLLSDILLDIVEGVNINYLRNYQELNLPRSIIST